MASFSVFAQHTSIVWQKGFGTEDGDNATDIMKIDTGYILLSSSLDSSITSCHGENDQDAWIVALDSSYDIQWRKCYGGSEGEYFTFIKKNPMGGYYVLGYTRSSDGDINTPIHGWGDLWLMRLDSSFDIIWSRTLSSPTGEEEIALVATPDGGAIVMAVLELAGYDVSTAYADGDIWLCKVDSTSSITWDKTIGNYYLDYGNSIIEKDENSYLIAGSSERKGGMVECHRSEGMDYSDVIVYEIDTQGNILWQHCYGGNNDDYAYQIIKQKDGFLLLCSTHSNDLDVSGLHTNSTRETTDIWLVKCDQYGEIVWQKCLGGSGDEWPLFMDTTSTGDIVIFAQTLSNDGDVNNFHGDPENQQWDIWVVVTDSVGNIKWNTCYGGVREEYLIKALKKSDYDFLLLARAYDNSGDINCLPYPSSDYDYDIWLFEINICFAPPPVPPAPLGPDKVCTEESPSTVYTLPPSGNYSYEWILEPQEAGAMETADNEVIVNWTEDFTGTSAIVARAVDIVCGNSEWSQACFTIVHNCTGINLSENKNIRVWPNPGNEKVVFEIVENVSVKNPGVVEIYNRMGQSVAYFEIADDKANWFCEHVPDGIYIYRFMIDNKVVVGKIAINH